MITNRYDFILVRVEHPLEGGYRMEPKKLPFYLHLSITKEGDRKTLTVHSEVHVEKEFTMPTSYSSDYSDWEIIKDQSDKISMMYMC